MFFVVFVEIVVNKKIDMVKIIIVILFKWLIMFKIFYFWILKYSELFNRIIILEKVKIL